MATLIGDTANADGSRAIRLQLSAPATRIVRLRIPAAAHPVSFTYGDRTTALREPQQGYYLIEILGRAADGAVLDFTLKPPADAPKEKPDWLVQGIWTELPSEARAIADMRPDNAVRIQMGDTTITTKKQQF